MNIDELLERPSAWLMKEGPDAIVFTSRVRLARNLVAEPFPGWAGEEECSRIWNMVKPILTEVPLFKSAYLEEMPELSKLQKQMLFERNLISQEQADKGSGSGVVISNDESLSLMVNEEDHLRIQSIMGGLNLKAAFAKVSELDRTLEEELEFAFDERLGYLTACPSNVGTGMRASNMLHVPGLVLMNEINPIIKGLGKIGLAVRGLGGEGSEATGNMFQISNQITLGEKEELILENLQQIVAEIVEHEKNARKRLLQKKESVVRDHVGRALGILSNAHILTSKEALDLISGLRLGIDLGIIDGVDVKTVDQLLLSIRPAYLQQLAGKQLDPQERDISRAAVVRDKIKGKLV